MRRVGRIQVSQPIESTRHGHADQTESGMYRRNRHLRVVRRSHQKLSRIPVDQPQLTVVLTENATGEVPLDQSPVYASPLLRQSVRSIIRPVRLIEE